MKLRWNTLGGKLGLLFCVAGLGLIWAGWNGAATYNDIRKQFPYLISGGIAGLGLIHVGVGLWIVQSQRAERARLEENLAGLNRVLGTLVEVVALSAVPGGVAGGNGLVLAGTTAYHRPACPLVQDHPRLATTTAELAAESGLAPCRTCEPASPVVHLPH